MIIESHYYNYKYASRYCELWNIGRCKSGHFARPGGDCHVAEPRDTTSVSDQSRVTPQVLDLGVTILRCSSLCNEESISSIWRGSSNHAGLGSLELADRWMMLHASSSS